MKPRVKPDSHACVFVLIRPYTSANRPPVTSTVPTTSSVFAVGSFDSSTAYRVAAAATTPIGTLIQNTADQST